MILYKTQEKQTRAYNERTQNAYLCAPDTDRMNNIDNNNINYLKETQTSVSSGSTCTLMRNILKMYPLRCSEPRSHVRKKKSLSLVALHLLFKFNFF